MNPQNALAKARRRDNQASNTANQVKSVLSFRKKISKYWPIFFLAVIFDLIGLIPVVNVMGNFLFGIILFIKFGSKKNIKGTDNLIGIAMPILLGSALDWIISIVPVNLGAALIRIALSEE